MDAREIERSARRLAELKRQVVERLVLAALTVGGALAATQLHPAFAVPLLVGGIALGFLGVRSFVRRTFLLEDLALETDAYAIADVRRFGLRAASPGHRRALARSFRATLTMSATGLDRDLTPVREELEELIAALEDEGLGWDPQAAVTLERWLQDSSCPLHDPATSTAELRARLRGILARVHPAL